MDLTAFYSVLPKVSPGIALVILGVYLLLKKRPTKAVSIIARVITGFGLILTTITVIWNSTPNVQSITASAANSTTYPNVTAIPTNVLEATQIATTIPVVKDCGTQVQNKVGAFIYSNKGQIPVFSSPDEQRAQIAWLEICTPQPVIGRNAQGDWLKIALPEGNVPNTGWVLLGDVDFSGKVDDLSVAQSTGNSPNPTLSPSTLPVIGKISVIKGSPQVNNTSSTGNQQPPQSSNNNSATITRTYLKNDKLWLKPELGASQWISKTNNGKWSSHFCLSQLEEQMGAAGLG